MVAQDTKYELHEISFETLCLQRKLGHVHTLIHRCTYTNVIHS